MKTVLLLDSGYVNSKNIFTNYVYQSTPYDIGQITDGPIV